MSISPDQVLIQTSSSWPIAERLWVQPQSEMRGIVRLWV